MADHAQLSAHDIRGPINQLNVNLAGKNGAEWLTALKRFLRKEDVWRQVRLVHIHSFNKYFESLEGITLRQDVEVALVCAWANRAQASDELINDVSNLLIQPYLQFCSPEGELLIEFDQTIDMGNLIDAVDHRHVWRKVAELVKLDMIPNDAYLRVLFEKLALDKKFRFSFGDLGNEVLADEFECTIRLGFATLDFEVESEKLVPYLTFDGDSQFTEE